MITRILLGFVFAAIGSVMVLKTAAFYEFFGSVPFAEKYLGGGGSRLFYKLLGIVLALFGFSMIVGLHTALLGGVASFLFGASTPR